MVNSHLDRLDLAGGQIIHTTTNNNTNQFALLDES